MIDAANSQPFSHIHRPGVAVGGHCIPVYPRFYLAGDPDAAAARARRARSTRRCPPTPSTLLAELAGGLGGTRVLILGVAYRGGVKETAFSGALRAPRRARSRAARSPSPPTRSTTPPSCARSGFEPWDGDAGRRGDRAGRPRRVRARSRPADLPAPRAILDGRGVLDPRALRRGRRDGAAPRPPRRLRRQPASVSSAATTRSPALPVAVELGPLRRAAAGPAPRSAASASRSTSTFQPLSTVSTHSVVSRSVTQRHAGEVGLLLHAAGVGRAPRARAPAAT